MCGLLTVVASLVAECWPTSCGYRALEFGLSSYSTWCSSTCGIFRDQGLSLYPLHWQVDSFLLLLQRVGHNWVLTHASMPSLSHVWLFCKTSWTGAHQAPLHGILQARILEWFAISFSRGSFWPRDWTWVFCLEALAGIFFTEPPGKSNRWILNHWTTKEVPPFQFLIQ